MWNKIGGKKSFLLQWEEITSGTMLNANIEYIFCLQDILCISTIF